MRLSKALLQLGAAESPHGWVYAVALDECTGAGLGWCLGSWDKLTEDISIFSRRKKTLTGDPVRVFRIRA